MFYYPHFGLNTSRRIIYSPNLQEYAGIVLHISIVFCKEYTEKEQAAADPTEPPVRSIETHLQQPLERIQKYKALLKVMTSTFSSAVYFFFLIIFYIFIIYYLFILFFKKIIIIILF